MIAAVWIASIIISSPPLFGWRAKDDEFKETGGCTLIKLLSYRIYSSVGSFFLPALVMLFVYARIFKVIHDREKYLMSSNEVTHRRKLPKTKPLVKDKSEVIIANKSSILSSGNCNTVVNNIMLKTKRSGKTNAFAKKNITFKNEMNTIDESDNHDRYSHSNQIEPTFDNNKLLKKQKTVFFNKLNNSATTVLDTDTNNNGYKIKSTYSSTPVLNDDESSKHNLKENDKQNEIKCKNKKFYHDIINIDKSKRRKFFNTSTHHFCSNNDHHLNKFSNSSTSGQNTNQTRVQEELRLLKESKAAKTLAIVVGGFIICWLPFFVVYILEPFCPTCNIPYSFIDSITWLGYVNSAINPFIYAFYSKQFRSAFYRLTLGMCKRNKDNKYFSYQNNKSPVN